MSKPVPHPGVVVGVDGSPASKVAVYWAARDAAMRNVALTLVHVISATAATWLDAPMPGAFAQWQEDRGHVVLNDALKLVEDNAEEHGPAQIDRKLFSSGAIPTLVDLSKEAEMIVVGCRGRGPLQQRLLGSVSSELVQRAYCPVAVIHDEDPLMPHPAQAPVLVGVDGSPASELATEIAFDEASRRGVELVALHAWSDDLVYEYPGTDWPTVESSADEVLAERLAGWQERYPDVTVRRVVVGDQPGRMIVLPTTLRSASMSKRRAPFAQRVFGVDAGLDLALFGQLPDRLLVFAALGGELAAVFAGADAHRPRSP